MFDRRVRELGRGAAESDHAEDPGGADDMPHLLRIVKLGKQVAGKQGFRGGLDPAAATFPAHANARGEGVDLRAFRKIQRRNMFTPSLGAETKPAKSACIQQGTEKMPAQGRGGTGDKRRKSGELEGGHSGGLPFHFV
jgi:hypothetical protein